jgi:hypothetical protein
VRLLVSATFLTASTPTTEIYRKGRFALLGRAEGSGSSGSDSRCRQAARNFCAMKRDDERSDRYEPI